MITYESEVAYDGHNDEIWADIFRLTEIESNVIKKEEIKRVLIQHADNPSMESIISMAVNYLNNEQDAGISEYNTNDLYRMPSYVSVPKTPLFEIEEYDKDKFRVIEHLNEEQKKQQEEVLSSRQIKPQHEILDYGFHNSEKTRYWGVLFSKLQISPTLSIKQEVDIKVVGKPRKMSDAVIEPTLPNLVKVMLIDAITYHFADIQEYDLNNPVSEPVYICEKNEPPFRRRDYGAFTILDEVLESEVKERIMNTVL